MHTDENWNIQITKKQLKQSGKKWSNKEQNWSKEEKIEITKKKNGATIKNMENCYNLFFHCIDFSSFHSFDFVNLPLILSDGIFFVPEASVHWVLEKCLD